VRASDHRRDVHDPYVRLRVCPVAPQNSQDESNVRAPVHRDTDEKRGVHDSTQWHVRHERVLEVELKTT